MTTGPVTPAAAVKVSVPSALTTTLPSAALTFALVTVSASLSASLSLPSTATVTGACATVLEVSLRAAGGSLTGVTVSRTVAGAETPPSLSVTVKVNDVLPFQWAFGRKTRLAACAAVSTVPAATGASVSPRSSAPLAGAVRSVTLVTLPSMSVPASETSSRMSSPPLLPLSMASGRSLTAVTAMRVPPSALPVPLLTL